MNFKDYLLIEASYKGNIGMMETFKFFQIATSEQKAELKRLLANGNQNKAWELIQKVSGVKLHNESSTRLKAKKIPDGYNDAKWVWAVVEETPDGDRVVESGFDTKRDAIKWIARNN